jgi:hypothetical protein
MLRKLVCSIFAMSVCIGLVAAEEFSATIRKVDGDKVTFSKVSFKDKKVEKGDDMTLPVAKDVKVAKGKANFKDKKFSVEVGDKIEDGLKNEIFTKIDEKKGLFVRITTSEDNKSITQILVTQFGGKKKKDEDKKTDK